MSVFDIVLLGIILSFGLFGLWFGLISTMGALVGTVLGVFFASRIYVFPADWLVSITHWSGNFPKVATFIICFLIINRLVGLGFHILDKMLFRITSLPYINGLNKILGFIFGIFEGILVTGVIFYVIDRYPLWQSFMDQAAASKVVTVCEGIASFLWPLLPAVMKIM